MSSHRSIRFGVVHEPSNDKGPYKLARVMADGKAMDVELMDITGVEGSPLKESRVIIFTPDGDDGKAVGIVYGPPIKERTDGQKPGEVTYKNHKTGTVTRLKDNGDMEIEVKGDQRITITGTGTIKAPTLILDADVQIKGNVQMDKNLHVTLDIANGGNMTTVGLHRDGAGGHS